MPTRAAARLAPAPSARVAPLSELAGAYLRATLREDCEPLRFPAPAPGAAHEARRRREWRRRWDRLCVADHMAAFSAELARARAAGEVYDAFSAHAARVVGAYACLLFVPAAGAFRARPHPALTDAAALSVAEAARIPVVLTTASGGFAGLAPLFPLLGAASLACAPVAGGMAVLVERRGERRFDADDWDLLRVLAAEAEAALERVRVQGRMMELAVADPLTGLAGGGHLKAVLRHAGALAAAGERVAVVVASAADATTGGAPDRDALPALGEALRRATAGRGIALRCGAGEFLVLLPGATEDDAAALMESVRAHIPASVSLRARAAIHTGEAGALDELVARVAGEVG